MSSPAIDHQRLVTTYFAARTSEAFALRPLESHGTGTLCVFGSHVLIKLAGADTHGACTVMENLTEPQCGPPLHRNSREDEFFYVVEGAYIFEVDGEQINAGPGCCVFAPRGTAHAFQNVGIIPGRLLVVAQPAGLDEAFADLAEATRGMAEPELSLIARIFEKHGIEVLGPPLTPREIPRSSMSLKYSPVHG